MRVSTNWLKELVEVEDINEVANKMNLVGNELESIEKLAIGTNLVIGKVLKKEKHPDSDHLNVCEIDIKDSINTIVCGASNVDVNQKVIVAKVGAKLKDIEIKQVTIRGIESNGMICSLEELGIESKYLNEKEKNGIHVLDDNAVVGEDPLKYLGLDDTIINFELTSNRGDLLGMINMAHEVGAIFDKKVNIPNYDLNENNENIKDYIEIKKETDDCEVYLSRVVKNVVIKESPNFIKYRLIASGIRPINNVVDISNYVMLEYNQPLHFFDYDKLDKSIIIRNAKENEEIITLDNIKRNLLKEDIVIANKTEPIALAGVMGGLSTEITSNTKTILIESANFKSASIRKTSNRILRSESSIRFEKKLDSNSCRKALNKAAFLLQQYASGEVVKGVEGFEKENELKTIQISLNKINLVLGLNITISEVENIFKRLGFICDIKDNNLYVTVSSRRTDILIEEDLIEEVGRFYGYDKLEGKLPIVTIKKGNYSKKYSYVKKVRNLLKSMSLNEVITYSLIKEEDLYKFTNDKFNKVELISYMSEDKKVLRYSLIQSLLNVIEYNNYRNIKNVNIFEIGKGFYKEETYKEDLKLSIAITDNYVFNSWNNNNIKSDFYVLKGILENIFKYFSYNYEFRKVMDCPKEFNISQTAEIYIENIFVGYIGKVHPNINKNDIFVCEINLEKLLELEIKKIKFNEIPKYPNIIKDMAFIFDKNINSIEVVNYIKDSSTLIKNVEVFDFYKDYEENKNSVAFKITFNSLDKTLTDEEVLNLFNKIIINVEEKFNCVLRNK